MNDESLEQLLKKLPTFDRDPLREKAFFQALKKRSQHRESFLEKLVKMGRGLPVGLGASAAALFIFAVTTAWAYQPTVTRGHFLYSWKKSVEGIELAAAISPLRKVDTHVRFADRRLAEAEYIVNQDPTLAAFFPVARAHVGDVHLDEQQAVYLYETLQEMRNEITTASEIVENEVARPADIDRALEKIETVTDKQVQRLAKIQQKVSAEISAIVQVISDEQDEQLASVVEAHEEVKVAVEEKKPTIKVEVIKKVSKLEADAETVSVSASAAASVSTDRKGKASAELKTALEAYSQLPAPQQEKFKAKIEQATSAIAEGKFGRAEGLSRSVSKRIENTNSAIVPLPEPPPPPPDPTSAAPTARPAANIEEQLSQNPVLRAAWDSTEVFKREMMQKDPALFDMWVRVTLKNNEMQADQAKAQADWQTKQEQWQADQLEKKTKMEEEMKKRQEEMGLRQEELRQKMEFKRTQFAAPTNSFNR